MPMTNPHFCDLGAILKADPKVRKATTALGVTALGGIGASMADGNLTIPEVVIALGAALVAAAAVWRVPNGG